jgi:hypothetical protein
MLRVKPSPSQLPVDLRTHPRDEVDAGTPTVPSIMFLLIVVSKQTSTSDCELFHDVLYRIGLATSTLAIFATLLPLAARVVHVSSIVGRSATLN